MGSINRLLQSKFKDLASPLNQISTLSPVIKDRQGIERKEVKISIAAD